MNSKSLRGFIVRLVSFGLISMGFVQASSAGMIGSDYLVESESRAASLERLDVLLARESVARQLEAYGVDPAMVSERLRGMTSAELLALEGRIDSDTVGGDAIGVIGTVFLVLLILELVGVTDIFKSI